jgi:predicted HicB family RNase H-like nuclease
MTKKVSFRAKPPSSITTAPILQDQDAIDAWVNDEKLPVSEPMKRFTFEVPQSLHKRIKIKCAAQGRQMAEAVRELLEKHFPEE